MAVLRVQLPQTRFEFFLHVVGVLELNLDHDGQPLSCDRRPGFSPTSPTFDVSACAATEGAPVFPLQIGFLQSAGQRQAEALEEDFLVVVGLRHAAGADFVAVLGG